MDGADDVEKNRRIQSVEVGFGILRVLADYGRPMTLGELSSATGLFKSQLYRYLNSFLHLGAIVRHELEVPRWSLGPELIALGGAAFEGLDLAKYAESQLIELRNRLNETVALSIWRERGAFFLRWEKSNKATNVGVDTGSYVPLYSATGKVFRAFLPRILTEQLYLESVNTGAIIPSEYEAEIDRIRASRLSVTESSLTSGTTALSTPIFDATGSLAGALTVIGLRGVLDISNGAPPAQELIKTAAEISYRLGHRNHVVL